MGPFKIFDLINFIFLGFWNINKRIFRHEIGQVLNSIEKMPWAKSEQAEIQIPVKQLLDSSLASLIHSWLVSGRVFGHQKLAPNSHE